MLGHPHTSAGRVPTTAGYRYYTSLLERRGVEPQPFAVDLSGARGELDSALRSTAEALAQATDLLAAVSAPSLDTTVVRHVELVPLQPQLVMAVVITASGGVAKRLFVFEQAVDAGLLEWARDYINESIVGLRLGARTLRQRLSRSLARHGRAGHPRAPRAGLHAARRRGLALPRRRGRPARRPARRRARLAARGRERARGAAAAAGRAARRARLRSRLDPRRRRLGRAGAALALARRRQLRHRQPQPRHGRPDRPQRMDYVGAMRAVRGAAAALSEFVEEIYDT